MKNEKKENRKCFRQERWRPISYGIIHSARFRDVVKICLLPMMLVAVVQGILQEDIVVFWGNIIMIILALLFIVRLIVVYRKEKYRREPTFGERTELRYGFSSMGWVMAAWYSLLFGCYAERSPKLFLDFAFYVTPVFLLVLLVLAIRQWQR